MKKQLMLSFIAVVAAAGSLMAQTSAELSTPAGKTKAAVTKLTMDAGLQLTEAQRVKTIGIFQEYYTAAATPANAAEALTKRDQKLAQVFTAAQMEDFKKRIEAKL